jgi:hypothetical protein
MKKRKMDPKLTARVQDHEVSYVARKFKTTQALVRAAIETVGRSRKKVYERLRQLLRE